MQRQLEWLFVKSLFPVKYANIDSPHFYIGRDDVDYQFSVKFFKSDSWIPEKITSGYYKKINTKWVLNGTHILYLECGDPFCPLFTRITYDNDKAIKRYIECTTPEGHRFVGDSLAEKVWPHGGGQWTFADGTTLTGDRVAFDGLPHGEGREGETRWFAGEPMKKKRKVGPSMRRKEKVGEK